MRVFAWPRSPRKITSWPASSAFSSCGRRCPRSRATPSTGGFARRDPGDRVGADLVLDRAATPSRSLAGRRGLRVGSCPHCIQVRIVPRQSVPHRPGLATPRSLAARACNRRRTTARTDGRPAPSISRAPGGSHASDGDLARRFTDPSISRRRLARGPGPGHWRSRRAFADHRRARCSTAARSSATAARRRAAAAFLSFDGIFYYGDIWLDGGYLGATEGYFFPHTFEVTDQACRSPTTAHLLAVEVACPPQRDRTAKRTITGVFSHWDNLDPDWNPGGIWRPVRLRDTGPVRIKSAAARCAVEATETRGRLLLDVTLDAGADPNPAPLRRAALRARSPGPTADARRRRRTTSCSPAGDNTLTLDASTSTSRRAGGRGGSASSRSATSTCRRRGRRRAERRPPAAHRVPRDPHAATGS